MADRVRASAGGAAAESRPGHVKSGKSHSLADFRPLIERLCKPDGGCALIGGMAVAIYGERYLTPQHKSHFHFPIYSKDIDLEGGREIKKLVADAIAALGYTGRQMGSVQPKDAIKRVPSHFVGFELGGEGSNVEILESLPLDAMAFTDEEIGTWITIDGISILDPFTLLLAKLAALHERPQGESHNDAQHCQILVEAIPAFLRELATLRENRGVEYDALADAWRLWLVLERGHFPLPVASAASRQFAGELHHFVVSNLIAHGRLVTDAEAREAAQRLLAAHGLTDAAVAELRVLYTVAGWYRVALVACHGAPSHVVVIDAAGRPLARPDAERALTYDRLSGGILHQLHYMEPVEPGADPTLVARAREKYLAWLIEQCGSMQLDGLPADSDLSVRRMRLEQLFVPLRLSVIVKDEERPVADPRTGQEIPGMTIGGAHVETESVGAVLTAHPRLAILAAPGGGKSTLLKRLAAAYADPQRLAEIADGLPRRPWLPFRLLCRGLGLASSQGSLHSMHPRRKLPRCSRNFRRGVRTRCSSSIRSATS